MLIVLKNEMKLKSTNRQILSSPQIKSFQHYKTTTDIRQEPSEHF